MLSWSVHAAAIYGAETLAVSPPYGGSNAPATIFISVTATPWKWEPAEWEPPSPRLVMPRASSTRTYYPSNSPSFAWCAVSLSLSLSLSLFLYVRTFICCLFFSTWYFSSFICILNVFPPFAEEMCTFAKMCIHVHYVGQTIINGLTCIKKYIYNTS